MDDRTSGLAGGGPAPVLQTPKPDLIAAAAPVAVTTLLYLIGLLREIRSRMPGLMPLASWAAPEPVGVVATVAEQPLRLSHIT